MTHLFGPWRFVGPVEQENHPMTQPVYTIRRGPTGGIGPKDLWDRAEVAQIDHFHPASVSQHPKTECRVLYNQEGFRYSFQVRDRWVRAQALNYQDQVCLDSCVEFFVQAAGAPGYFNFEVNCIGTLLLSYIEDPHRTPTGFVKATPVRAQDAARITIEPSITQRPFLPERTEPLTWQVDVGVPFELLRSYVPDFQIPRSGTEWRGNFFKCGDETSHPHWASWAPIGEELNFHVPRYFGKLVFE
jgi:hypothetical protein